MAFWSGEQDRARVEANIATAAALNIGNAAIRGFQGRLVRMGDPAYDRARALANPAFRRFPKLVAFCVCQPDIRIAFTIARNIGRTVVCRSGGHSTAGFSTHDGVVIDLSGLDQIFVDPVQRTACVQTGARFGAINAMLDEYGLHMPGGGCEDVCAGGYMQGGGYGFSSRRHGMHSDNVLSFRMMLADGRVVPASRDRNPDLFWAVRGGTGNNFGVLLDTTYRLHTIEPVWGFSLRWDLEAAPEALEEMQKDYMLTGAPPDLGYMTLILADTSKKMALWMRGMYFGSATAGKAALSSLLRTKGVTMDIDEVGSYYALNRKLLDQGLAFPPPPKHLNEDKQSGYIEKALTRADWTLILDRWNSAPHYLCCGVIEPYGGRIAEIPVHDSAFMHRSVSFNFVVDTFWEDDAERHRSVAWLNDFMALMEPYFNGQVYQNYPRAVMADYPLAFWGLETYVELCAIKKKYDPDGFFSFPQAIGKWVVPAGAKGIGDPALTAAIQNAVIATEI